MRTFACPDFPKSEILYNYIVFISTRACRLADTMYDQILIIILHAKLLYRYVCYG